jgi:hypothetical protein
VETIVKEDTEQPLKFYLFYAWHGISRLEILANSWNEAERKAKQFIETIELKGDPIKWAYLVEADLGKILRGE